MAATSDHASPFQIRTQRSGGGRLALWLAGDIDARERDFIVAELEAGEAPSEISIDMSSVGFLGSAGLSALIHACRQLEPLGERVVLVDPPASVATCSTPAASPTTFAIQLG